MKKLVLLKTKNNHNLFANKQKVWQIFGTGALASYVAGRYKGKGRWIKAWVHFAENKKDSSFSGRTDADFIGQVEVSDSFYNHIISV